MGTSWWSFDISVAQWVTCWIFKQTEKISFGVPGSSPAAVRNFRKNFNVYIHLPLLLDFGNKKMLLNSVLNLKRERSLRFSVFHEPKYLTSLYKSSFISIAIQLLNSFINSNVWLTDIFRSMFNGQPWSIYSMVDLLIIDDFLRLI